ncbi:CDP-glycerol glycerophosphotransferase family protein [Aquihabitans sp. G128]|uniref:CDP-glycerol glycerophosphotransferase family protein n=1 Tax=Aquihabitans sp. G128 TaxID=2849779 RepID=UPI001C211ACB|nr:CDP-glycerol glycerophosphotransferase family protein [Aquihabitans sp. G128]QXC60254.1 CDP-glycerol glycerophosphotransferase family protein [Aquihabitans sp. G128]
MAAIDRGDLPADLRIVLRRHPTDNPGRWDRFEGVAAVAFDDPGAVGAQAVRPGQVDLGRDQIVGLCSSLAHTDVHVSVSSTMTLDGAFFDKPQLGPAYDRRGQARHRRRARDLYAREHFLPIVASGGLELSASPEELVGQVRSGLARPERLQAERRTMLEALCTATDGRAIERVADEVGRFVQEHATA